MRTPYFILIELVVGAALYYLFRTYGNDYVFFASYIVLQYIVVATAWNILGGYCGYVNFGSAGFFALGAYSSVFFYNIGQQMDELFSEQTAGLLHYIFPMPVPVLIVIGGVVAGLVGMSHRVSNVPKV